MTAGCAFNTELGIEEAHWVINFAEVMRWLRPRTKGAERTVERAGLEMIGAAESESIAMTMTMTMTTTTIATATRPVTVVGR